MQNAKYTILLFVRRILARLFGAVNMFDVLILDMK